MRELNFDEVEQIAGGNMLTDLHARLKAGLSRQDIEYGIFAGSVGLALGGMLKGNAAPICALIIVAGVLAYDFYNPTE